MPEGEPWPTWRDVPQAFLAELHLAELRRAGGPLWLPDRGRLLFFYDSGQTTLGAAPADRGSWSVVYASSDGPESPREPPDGAVAFAELALAAFADESLPTLERAGLDPESFSAEEWERFCFGEGPLPGDQVGGWPQAIQDDRMELQCQLTSQGFDGGDPETWRGPAAEVARAAAADWKLLLQLGSHDNIGMGWGDGGTLYFWVREQDARAGDFANVWMIQQCF